MHDDIRSCGDPFCGARQRVCVERVGVRVSGRILIRLVTLVGRILIFQSKALVSRVHAGRWAASAFFLKSRVSEWATLVGIDCDTAPAHCALCAHRALRGGVHMCGRRN